MLNRVATGIQADCESNIIAAYIDGELDDDARVLFEQHMDDCSDCRSELRSHRLFICELDAAMTQDIAVAVPDNFSRLVAARAESDMSGVRSALEHRRALSFCLILALAAFALLGTTARSAIMSAGRTLIGSIFGVLSLVWTTVYDTAVSVTVISRAVSRKLIVEPLSLGLSALLLAVAVLLLSRLISNYHRTGAIE